LTATKFEMKARPTNADLQAQTYELHECLHQTGKAVDELGEQLGEAVGRVDDLGVLLTAVAHALHVEIPSREALAAGKLPRIRSRLGSMRPWQAVVAVVPAVVAGLTAYKFLEPAVAAFFVALHHALLAAR
jgi:hypothetical protein